MSKVKVGDPAPDFTLTSGEGEQIRLSDFRDKKTVVLFFYPKDDSPGCTVEVCNFRDSHSQFAGAGAEVIGVSSDSEESHQKFASKHSLPMKLLSDPGGKVRDLYGVKSTLGLIPGRVTFVIDKAGVVRYMFSSQVRVNSHVEKALAIVQGL
jgi:peroxiredoxin Q/BCP